MTAEELIRELECVDPESEVLIKPCNSIYVDCIDNVYEENVRAFFGEDYKAVIIYAESQVGAV